jgi:lactoylglutathione lyase
MRSRRLGVSAAEHMLDVQRASAVHGASIQESLVKVGYVVLYVNDPEACSRFWVEQVGMVEKRRSEAGDFAVVRVGFADQPFAFELVPIELMKDNPDGLDLATPSICFVVDDLGSTHDSLIGRGVHATDVGDHEGTPSFAFSDPEGRWFAVTQ